jgi:hypothetical protein
MSDMETLKQAALESVNGAPAEESRELGSYTRGEVQQMLEDILNQDVLQRDITDTADNVAEKIREALWPEFDLETKKVKAQKDVERKALLMHLKDLIGEANGRGD